MIKKLENKLMMLNAVVTLFKQNSSSWGTTPALTELTGKLEAYLAEIESLRQITENDTTGLTAEKRTQQDALIDKAYELSSSLYAMASGKGDKVLLGKVNFTESDLQNARGNDLISTCRSLVSLTTESLLALAPYGITQEDITELERLTTLFAEKLPVNRLSVIERKAANERLKNVFLQTDSLLNEQIDRIMVRFKNSAPNFYIAYNHARTIVNYGMRYEKGSETSVEEK